jgi:homoserine dehydrogenase
LIPEQHLLAKVDGVMNAVVIDGDAAGQTLYYGAGAGDMATASAVVADLVDIARARNQGSTFGVPSLGHNADQLNDYLVVPIEDVICACYLRILVRDQPGVLAKIAAILSEHMINIESISQKETDLSNGLIPMIMLTHAVPEKSMNHAIKSIEALNEVVDSVKRIRVADLSD